MAWADQLGIFARHAWPCIVSYCYFNAESGDVLHGSFDEAVNMWQVIILQADSRKISNKEFISILHWAEHLANRMVTAYTSSTSHYLWTRLLTPSSIIPHDTLVIQFVPMGYPNKATVGYLPWGDEPGRHNLRGAKNTEVQKIAHEISHVLGILHEHQRWDREQYLKFTCENVWGYETAVRRCEASEDCDMDMLCTYYGTASDLPWTSGRSFTVGNVGDLDSQGPFDFESVMLYSAEGWADKDECSIEKKAESCPLCKRTADGGLVEMSSSSTAASTMATAYL
ncbi:hypothetical protein B0J11DRAFT_614665 [Dendryphion nanum]|uniref:Peptidase M12A domain-containing protein n=1 Tax=Dendryphion nanum TaxID=256645 RepID=A0A9P9DU08_9PLEO|nr:hypothetical protein B0J11DRAFT_614665 [Dendryphion nanum]